jgi:3-oxoadipate enol-lactonase
MKVRANGLSLEVQMKGQAGPWVILSHSLATNLSMWEEQTAILSRDFRVVLYDTRGHGGSDVPSGPYHMRDLIDDVVGLMDALSIARAHFVGLSLGGATGIGLAIAHPERLSSVAICDARADAPASFRVAWEERIRTVQEQGMVALAEPTLQRWFTHASYTERPALIGKVRAMIGSTPPAGFIGCARALQTLDYDTQLQAITIPILLLVGAEDSVFPELNRGMLARIPSARLVSIPAAGHLSNLEQPDAFLAALLDFLHAAGQ